MSLVSFFFTNKPIGNIGGITVDATINDSVSYDSGITSFPIEDGSYISDHITLQPYSVSINGIITDTPFFLPNIFENVAFNSSSVSRVKNAYEELLTLYINKEPFTVITGLDIYSDMFFTSFNIARDANTGHALSFDAKFEKVNYATTVIVTIPKETVLNGHKDLSQSDIKKGAQQASDAENKRQSTSLLYNFFGSSLGNVLR